MKKTIFTLLSFLSLAAQAQNCRVVGISDGDTLTCLASGNQQIKVRLNQIDAPESRQAFGTQAKQKLSNLVFGKTVTLNIQDKDRYGRTVAEVFSGSLNVNKELVKGGYAWAYRQYVRDNEYINLENHARAARIGLWHDPSPINPSDFRKGVRNGAYKQPTTRQPFTHSAPTPHYSSGLICGNKRVCAEMNSCSEAQFYLHSCGLKRLDRDKDGVACEAIC